ncbi:hypothetical protein ACFQO4_04390 [Saliphagus sp. GCM10025334]|uniref:DUF7836 domain-containing protein n=1 Tax=Natronosalvus rutilus TaxID=2953753 RepID=A0A9E7NB51_9EURY|nr:MULTISPECIES: hypothetical protein [Natronosalvus]UTF55052.1 hypothetical protein NGM29_07310 [Natronosalvus rutilus]
MVETTVQLVCPECVKEWQLTPAELPDSTSMFHCPNCHASRRMAEFTRTDRDLRTLKQLG